MLNEDAIRHSAKCLLGSWDKEFQFRNIDTFQEPLTLLSMLTAIGRSNLKVTDAESSAELTHAFFYLQNIASYR